MGKLLLVACTNVGRYIIEEFMTNAHIGAELVGVINLSPKCAVNKANYDPYTDLAEKYGFPIHYCSNINDDDSVSFIETHKPDIILQSGWSQKFSDKVLALPKYGCIGEHPAPLPKGRGAACVNWAILTGETEWGDSYFRMVSEYDKGELYAQKFFTIEKYDTVFTVYEKVAQCAADTVVEYASKWTEGVFEPVKQDDNKATYYKRRCPADGEIKSFLQNANKLHDFIRAQTHPYPGAYITATKNKLYILSSSVSDDMKTDECPGTVFAKTDNGGILVAADDNSVIEILRVKAEKRPSMWASQLVSADQLPINIFDIHLCF